MARFSGPVIAIIRFIAGDAGKRIVERDIADGFLRVGDIEVIGEDLFLLSGLRDHGLKSPAQRPCRAERDQGHENDASDPRHAMRPASTRCRNSVRRMFSLICMRTMLRTKDARVCPPDAA